MSTLATILCWLASYGLARYSGSLHERQRLIPGILVWYLALLLGACAFGHRPQQVHAADMPPPAAQAWQRTLTRESQAVWGLQPPVALLGAQVQQESAWRSNARSPYAGGLAQFTAATAADMARWYPELGPADVYNPRWAIRALVRYDWRMYADVDGAATTCDQWAMTLSAYNGGPGWLARDRALCTRVAGCDPARWWGQVEQHTQRGRAAALENRAYPDRILHLYLPQYRAAGWSGAEVCHA